MCLGYDDKIYSGLFCFGDTEEDVKKKAETIMKIQDFRIGNVYKDNNGKSFILEIGSFSSLISHYYASKELLFDAVNIDIVRLKALGFIEKIKNEYSVNFINKWVFTLEYDNYNYYHLWLNGKHLVSIRYIHELQDIIRLFSKQELELK